jgi:hypothetical protein
MIIRALTLAVLCTGLATPAISQPATTQAADTRLFAMQSNLWVNLHHFLYVTTRARRGMDAGRASVTRSLADTVGFGSLSSSARADWDQALDYYTRVIAERDVLFDSVLVRVNVNLSRVAATASPRDAALDAEHGRMLERAAVAYRTLWWPRHDAANRQWIAAVTPLLRQHGDSAAAWETRAFDVRWPSTAIPVDVTAYANWAGAYTTEDPDHVTISSVNADNQGTAAFELLFHEVLHTMDRTLFERYRSAARAQSKRMLRSPTHPYIFYTAGEVTRRLFPGHVPYAEAVGLWERSQDFGAMRPLLQRHWQPWLDGQITLDEALRRIAVDL